MTKDKAIAELVRIWHSPHLDLMLKAGLAEVIDTLKESNLNDSLVRDSSDACKESESKLDLISRADAIKAVWKLDKDANEYVVDDAKEIHGYCTAIGVCVGELSALPSADITETETCQRCQDLTDTILNRQGDEIKRLKAEARPTWEWIPCSERLPEALQEVLVTSTHGHVYTSRIVHGDFEYGGNVLVWMPLPEPYKGGDSE